MEKILILHSSFPNDFIRLPLPSIGFHQLWAWLPKLWLKLWGDWSSSLCPELLQLEAPYLSLSNTWTRENFQNLLDFSWKEYFKAVPVIYLNICSPASVAEQYPGSCWAKLGHVHWTYLSCEVLLGISALKDFKSRLYFGYHSWALDETENPLRTQSFWLRSGFTNSLLVKEMSGVNWSINCPYLMYGPTDAICFDLIALSETKHGWSFVVFRVGTSTRALSLKPCSVLWAMSRLQSCSLLLQWDQNTGQLLQLTALRGFMLPVHLSLHRAEVSLFITLSCAASLQVDVIHCAPWI